MRPKEKNISRVSVQFEKHQPERRRGFGGYLFCNGGCCCCCCCLQSLGGLIGAAAGSANCKLSAGPVIGCYWTCLALLAGAILFVSLAIRDGAAMFAFSALLFLPVVQILASILTLIWIKIRRADFSDQAASLQTLGKITLYSFLGALAGGIAMLIGFQVFK